VFYLKLTLIALAMVDTWLIRKHVIQKSGIDDTAVSARGKILAGLSLACWAGAVVSGRLLAYTYIYLDSSFDVY
ncbi:MAG: hypothetical protein DMG11_31120, partial [Acidobacteria bacterium]